MPSKKRKRSESQTEKGKKKRRVIEAKLSTTIHPSKHAPPYIVAFPKGLPEDKYMEKDALEWGAYQETDEYGEGNRLIQASTPYVRYHATNRASSSKRENQVLIGVYNSKTKQLDIIPTAILNVDQEVKHYQKKSLSLGDVTYKERYSHLIGDFGSKQKKQSYNRNKANTLTNESTLGLDSASKAVLKKMKETKRQRDMKSGKVRKDLPQYDDKTEFVEDIYDINHIISEEMRAALRSNLTYTELLDQDKDISDSNLPKTIYMRLYEVKLDDEDLSFQERKETLENLFFLEILINFYKLRSTVMEDQLEEFPESIKEYLLQNYSETKSRFKYFKTKLHSQALLNLILIIGLITYKFKISLNHIAKDLSIGLHVVTKHAEQVGCKILVEGKTKSLKGKDAPVSTNKYAELVAPLSFPDISTKRKVRPKK